MEFLIRLKYQDICERPVDYYMYMWIFKNAAPQFVNGLSEHSGYNMNIKMV